MSRRGTEISRVLTRLESFKSDPAYKDSQYAIDANIEFLKAARSLPGYLWWLFTVAPKLDGSKLLELTDFPVEEWDIAMHERLIEMQRRSRPGLIAPIVGAITEYIAKESRDLVIADLGAGGMELDRQVAEWAITQKHPHKLTILAVDKSPITRRIAEKNLKNLEAGIELVEVGEIGEADLAQLRQKSAAKILIVMCTNDIFKLDSHFPPKYFDLVYHSLFRHHLDASGKEQLDRVVPIIAKKHLELDGFKSWGVVLPQTIVGWNYPNFLNGELFSNFRFRPKAEIVAYAKQRGEVSFSGMTGFYLVKYHT